jgi:hypothetical protein
MSNSTNINDLPVIKETVQIPPQQNPTPQNPPQEMQQNVSLDPNTINQIVNELHQATLSGATKLASRDIPMETLPIQQDISVAPNYVPEPSSINNNYISQENDIDTIVQKQHISTIKQNNIENIYNELQTPILLGVLYFLFQLPILKTVLYRTFPTLFLNDGNLSINGYIFYSTLFSIIFYFLNKLVGIFDTF